MLLPNLTVEDLKKLPLRAIVAFAARCARRVEHLSQLPEGHPEKERRRAAIEAAIQMAEDFSRGSTCPSVESMVQSVDASRGVTVGKPSCDSAAAAAAGASHAAASAWDALGSEEGGSGVFSRERVADARDFLDRLAHTTADLAAMDAFTAAVEAFDAIGLHNEDFVAAALQDYEKLLGLRLGHYPEAGQPINPSPDGPLGPL
jgi:hypothetical protein